MKRLGIVAVTVTAWCVGAVVGFVAAEVWEKPVQWAGPLTGGAR